MKKRILPILFIATITLLSACSKPTEILGEYEYEDTAIVGMISSSTLDYMKEQKAGTQYVIEEDSLTITNGEEKTELLDITYEKEELTDKVIEENYPEESSLRTFFDGYKKRYRYAIYDENGDKLGYYIFLMDGDVFVCHYARADSLIHWIDKIVKIEQENK